MPWRRAWAGGRRVAACKTFARANLQRASNQLDYDSSETVKINKDAQGTSWKVGLWGEDFNGHQGRVEVWFQDDLPFWLGLGRRRIGRCGFGWGWTVKPTQGVKIVAHRLALRGADFNGIVHDFSHHADETFDINPRPHSAVGEFGVGHQVRNGSDRELRCGVGHIAFNK